MGLSSLLVAAILLPLANAANSCISVDASFNLLAFNLNGKDFNAGPSDQWASGSATALPANGRPPFTGNSVSCYFSQFSNAVYVLGADSSNPKNMYIYNAAGKSWSTQQVNAPDGFDPTSLTANLDHDTNVMYGFSKGSFWSLSVGDSLSTATNTPLAWQPSENPPFDASNYKPVMGLAQNHIHFLNTPNVAAGSATIFVIHFAFWQPDAQPYGKFPAQHGQTASLFLNEGVQNEFAYIPDDGSNTFVINVSSNTTKTLAGPTTKDPLATYFGTPNNIIQLTSNGAVNYIPYSAGGSGSSGSWSPVQALAKVAPPAASTSAGGNAVGSKPSGSQTDSSTPSNTSAANAGPATYPLGGIFALMITTAILIANALVC